VSAAWYPDPQDSVRVRWWDGSGWTEHTREPEPIAVVAKQIADAGELVLPEVVPDAEAAPSAELEPESALAAREPDASQPPAAVVREQGEPLRRQRGSASSRVPRPELVPANVHGILPEAAPAAAAPVVTSVPVHAAPKLESEPSRTPRAPRIPPTSPDEASAAAMFRVTQPEGFVPRSTFEPLPSYEPPAPLESPNSIWSWLFCALPILQALVLLVSLFNLEHVSGFALRYGLVVVPTVLQVYLASRDAVVLRRRGYPVTAWGWAFLPLAYLLIRSVRVGRAGLRLLLVWLASCVVLVAVAVALLVPVIQDGIAVAGYQRGIPAGAPTSALSGDERRALLTPDGMAAQLSEDLTASGDTVDTVDCPPFEPEDAAIVTCSVTITGMRADADVQITNQYPTVAFVLLGLDWE
jgi:hypothetical protein